MTAEIGNRFEPLSENEADIITRTHLLDLHEPIAESWERRQQLVGQLTDAQLEHQRWFAEAFRQDTGVTIEQREELKQALIDAMRGGFRSSLAEVIDSVRSQSSQLPGGSQQLSKAG